jgi:hypothetical protein
VRAPSVERVDVGAGAVLRIACRRGRPDRRPRARRPESRSSPAQSSPTERRSPADANRAAARARARDAAC